VGWKGCGEEWERRWEGWIELDRREEEREREDGTAEGWELLLLEVE